MGGLRRSQTHSRAYPLVIKQSWSDSHISVRARAQTDGCAATHIHTGSCKDSNIPRSTRAQTRYYTAANGQTHSYPYLLTPARLILVQTPSCVDALILKFACVQMRAHSDSLPQAHSRPDPRIPRHTHIQTHSRPDSLARSHSDSLRLAQRLTRTESLGLPSGRHLPRARDNRPPSTLSTLGGSSASTGIPTACLAARAVASVIPSC